MTIDNKVISQTEAKKMLTELLGVETASSSNFVEYYNQIAYKIRLYLQTLESANDQLVSQLDLQASIIKQLGNEISDEFQQGLISKYVLAKVDTKLTNLLKQGYEIIGLLRRSITGEKIKYKVAIEYYGTTYEGQLSEEQILSMASPSFDRGSNTIKLRLDALSKAKIVSLMQQDGNYKVIQNKGIGHSTLYSSIRAQVDKKLNQGYVYETYRVLKSRYKSNIIPPAIWDKNEFEETYAQTIKNTASYVKGGDLFDEQYKFFGRSYPSLTTITTIRNTLEAFVSLVQQLPKENELFSALQQMFYKEEQLDMSAKDISDGAQKIIDELLKNIR